jgi:DNA repair exonuclease SbcCD ATPase subunit
MPSRRPSEKNTKNEILSAFDELLREKKALEAQLAAKPPQLPPEPPRNGKSAPEPEPIANPANLSQQKIEAIVEGLNRLQLNFGGAVSDLSEKLTLEAFKLQELRQSVTEEVQQLETLHNLQVADDSLNTLIQQYEESSKTFNEEFQQQQETVDLELSQAQKTWAKEQEDHRRLIKERNDTLHKTRQRDAKEYSYDLTLGRKVTGEEYDQEQKRLYQELAELQQTQEKQWAEREKAIAERETQFTELKTKVEAMPKDLEAAIKRAKEEGKGIAYQQAKVKADLAAKEMTGSTRTYELRIQSLQETTENQDARIQTLSKQLDAALKQVQDLAVKAIEGASNLSSFQAVKEIAIEQAKNQSKLK